MFLTSHVLHGGMRDLVLHCLAIKLLIWTVVAAAASGCFCRVLIVALILTCFHPLRARSFHPLWVRSFHFFFTPVLVKAAGTSRCFRLSVAPCTTFSLASCSLVCSMLTRVLRVVCWTDQPPCTSLSCSGPLHILQRTRARVQIRACFSCPALASGSRSRQSSLSRDRHSCSPAATAALAVCLVVSGLVSTQTRLC